MISIVIPTRNEEHFIDETLRKLSSGLTATPHEIIVSDGASSDKTVEIASRIANKVVVEPEPSRRTIGRGRNLGAAAAIGDFVVFLDADTNLRDPNDFFRRALKHFTENPKLIALTGRLRVNREEETFADWFFFGMVNFTYLLLNNVFRVGGSSGEFQMTRAEAFRKLGGFREDLAAGEDNDMFRRLATIGQTRMYRDLVIYHTGRRGHLIGWPRLLSVWFMNAIWGIFFDRSFSKEWKPIRTEKDLS